MPNVPALLLGGYLLLVAISMFGMAIPHLLLAIIALMAAIAVLASPWLLGPRG